MAYWHGRISIKWRLGKCVKQLIDHTNYNKLVKCLREIDINKLFGHTQEISANLILQIRIENACDHWICGVSKLLGKSKSQF